MNYEEKYKELKEFIELYRFNATNVDLLKYKSLESSVRSINIVLTAVLNKMDEIERK